MRLSTQHPLPRSALSSLTVTGRDYQSRTVALLTESSPFIFFLMGNSCRPSDKTSQSVVPTWGREAQTHGLILASLSSWSPGIRGNPRAGLQAPHETWATEGHTQAPDKL